MYVSMTNVTSSTPSLGAFLSREHSVTTVVGCTTGSACAIPGPLPGLHWEETTMARPDTQVLETDDDIDLDSEVGKATEVRGILSHSIDNGAMLLALYEDNTNGSFDCTFFACLNLSHTYTL